MSRIISTRKKLKMNKKDYTDALKMLREEYLNSNQLYQTGDIVTYILPANFFLEIARQKIYLNSPALGSKLSNTDYENKLLVKSVTVHPNGEICYELITTGNNLYQLRVLATQGELTKPDV